MAYSYDIEKMKEALQQLTAKNLDTKASEWLQQQTQRFASKETAAYFNLTFTAIPRFVNRSEVPVSATEIKALQQIRPALQLSGWSLDRLVRTWWLLQWPAKEERQYVQQIEGLFKSAEIKEQIALYGALPLLAYPEAFTRRASEGLRTNISSVFEAIALDNPYPAEYFEEAAWNQMVLKSFFMDVEVNRIQGMDERANPKLAHILSDYAHERWAAGRAVNPLLWRPVAPFIDDRIFPDIEKLFRSADERENDAAALACSRTKYKPAIDLLATYKQQKMQIETARLSWGSLE